MRCNKGNHQQLTSKNLHIFIVFFLKVIAWQWKMHKPLIAFMIQEMPWHLCLIQRKIDLFKTKVVEFNELEVYPRIHLIYLEVTLWAIIKIIFTERKEIPQSCMKKFFSLLEIIIQPLSPIMLILTCNFFQSSFDVLLFHISTMFKFDGSLCYYAMAKFDIWFHD